MTGGCTVLNVKNSDLKALSDALKELNESYNDFMCSMLDTVREVKTAKKLWHDGQKPWEALANKAWFSPNSFPRTNCKRCSRQPPNCGWNHPRGDSTPHPSHRGYPKNIPKCVEGAQSVAGKHQPSQRAWLKSYICSML